MRCAVCVGASITRDKKHLDSVYITVHDGGMLSEVRKNIMYVGFFCSPRRLFMTVVDGDMFKYVGGGFLFSAPIIHDCCRW